MNEKVTAILYIALSWVVVLVVYFTLKYIGNRRAGSDSRRAEELERRAADDNSALADAEQRTREAIEMARAANRESDRLIGEQAADNQRAEANNRRASELLKRAEKIVNKDSN